MKLLVKWFFQDLYNDLMGNKPKTIHKHYVRDPLTKEEIRAIDYLEMKANSSLWSETAQNAFQQAADWIKTKQHREWKNNGSK